MIIITIIILICRRVDTLQSFCCCCKLIAIKLFQWLSEVTQLNTTALRNNSHFRLVQWLRALLDFTCSRPELCFFYWSTTRNATFHTLLSPPLVSAQFYFCSSHCVGALSLMWECRGNYEEIFKLRYTVFTYLALGLRFYSCAQCLQSKK